MIHPPIASTLRAARSQTLSQQLDPDPPIAGRIAIHTFSVSALTNTDIVTVSPLINGPHRIRAIRYHQDIANDGNSSFYLAVSQNDSTVVETFRADDNLLASSTADANLFPTQMTQRLPLDRYIRYRLCRYKLRIVNSTPATRRYSVTIEVQMIGVKR